MKNVLILTLNRYWPVIDSALRSAAIDRRVSIKLLISWWKHSRPAIDYFLNSLLVISGSYRGVDIQVVGVFAHFKIPHPIGDQEMWILLIKT